MFWIYWLACVWFGAILSSQLVQTVRYAECGNDASGIRRTLCLQIQKWLMQIEPP